MNSAFAKGWKPVLTAALAATIIALLGALATDLGPWYFSLRMPAWKPPDWLFGPAWTLIFALSAYAAVLAWVRVTSGAGRAWVLLLFGVNAILQVSWSMLFFSLHRPDWALLEVIFLWISILLLIIGLAPISRRASVFLAPYLVWVTFAAILNLAVVRLNAPFAGN